MLGREAYFCVKVEQRLILLENVVQRSPLAKECFTDKFTFKQMLCRQAHFQENVLQESTPLSLCCAGKHAFKLNAIFHNPNVTFETRRKITLY